ncbi:NMD protein affecting ribosome stability and mRNA decay [Constrictibacter sp. MBR-5]|jgi:NMD protein affecting ribosome stability and mRNA decay|uniref:BCAM0308 family protein n=1 Tax=Constrictibacter sp. MBR-5 TaxID=3156467 RepID=UPI00339804F8
MKRQNTGPAGQPPGRRIAGRAQEDHVHDPYQQRQKPHEPAVCAECSAAFHHGRWQWGAAPAQAASNLCPACRRIHDDYPAGIVELEGSFLTVHKDEIVRLARHQGDLEQREHPLHRIMAVRERADGVEITTTDIHLPRRIGEALHHAYQGDLDYHYEDDRYFLRVRWSRQTEGR